MLQDCMMTKLSETKTPVYAAYVTACSRSFRFNDGIINFPRFIPTAAVISLLACVRAAFVRRYDGDGALQ